MSTDMYLYIHTTAVCLSPVTRLDTVHSHVLYKIKLVYFIDEHVSVLVQTDSVKTHFDCAATVTTVEDKSHAEQKGKSSFDYGFWLILASGQSVRAWPIDPQQERMRIYYSIE